MLPLYLILSEYCETSDDTWIKDNAVMGKATPHHFCSLIGGHLGILTIADLSVAALCRWLEHAAERYLLALLPSRGKMV